MLIFLLAFALIPLVVRSIGIRIGVQVFPLIAVLPLAAFIHALTVTPTIAAGNDAVEHVSWIPQLGMDLTVRLDALAWLMTLIVTGVGALVLFYCTFYFRNSQEGLGRFAAVLLAFTGSMYGLVIADNIYLLFIFWEATSVFSYLLIGHYTGRRASRSAALQTLIVTT
ncbi:MAG TPA: proton-conducting transporter membrane subunit, partial [Terrimesophilobacter sp.]|nr:proton-conducting transporter membrane subunit [Terrimesophilobacter sp.]